MEVFHWISVHYALSWMTMSSGKMQHMEQGDFDSKDFQSIPWIQILYHLGGQSKCLISIGYSLSSRFQLTLWSNTAAIVAPSTTTTGWQTSLSPALLRLAAVLSSTLLSIDYSRFFYVSIFTLPRSIIFHFFNGLIDFLLVFFWKWHSSSAQLFYLGHCNTEFVLHHSILLRM